MACHPRSSWAGHWKGEGSRLVALGLVGGALGEGRGYEAP
jgi:hypothetical protein